MNERIKQLALRIEGLNTRQQTALDAAEADGVSAEDRAKHLAEFDRLQVEKDEAKASLKRAESLAADQAASGKAVELAASFREQPHNPHSPAVEPERITIPARAKQHGPLVAFKGRPEDAYRAGIWAAGAFGDHRDFERLQHFRAEARKLGMDYIEDPTASFNGSAPSANLLGLSNQSGGYFVPQIIETAIIEITLAYGVLRQFAEISPMTSDTKVTPRYSARMQAYWIARGQKPTSSDPAWNAVQLIAKDLAAMTKIGRQVSEDSVVDLGEKVVMSAGEAFALAEDNAGFNGDGTSTYGGITGLIPALGLTANANSVVTATAHTTVEALTNGDFASVEGSAPNYPGADWAWYCHKAFAWSSMFQLGLVAGGNRVDTIAAGPNQQLFHGYPVRYVNVMPKAPESGQIGAIFADLKQSVKVGDRRGRTMQAGYENDDFTRQLMTILATERVDVNVHTVTDPLGDANAVGGPVMALKLA